MKIDQRIIDEHKTFKTCPFCENTKIEITTPKRKFLARGKVHEGILYIYKCTKCKLGFTTTLSDTISLDNFHKREIKINKK